MPATAVKLSELTVRELLEYERAAHLVCAKYENLNKMQEFASRNLYDEFISVKGIYDSILTEIEKRVKTIKK